MQCWCSFNILIQFDDTLKIKSITGGSKIRSQFMDVSLLYYPAYDDSFNTAEHFALILLIFQETNV